MLDLEFLTNKDGGSFDFVYKSVQVVLSFDNDNWCSYVYFIYVILNLEIVNRES